MKKLGLLSIGQTPRTDYVPIIHSILGSTVDIVEKGALDGVAEEDFHEFAPKTPFEHAVVSRLKNGVSVTLSKPALVSLINRKLQELQACGVDLAILMCTSEFHGVLYPINFYCISGREIIDNAVRAALVPGKKLGALVPLARQEANTKNKFDAMGYDVVANHASPYECIEKVAEAAKAFCDCDAVILHCMGYTREHRRIVHAACGRPVLESNALIGHMAAELLAD